MKKITILFIIIAVISMTAFADSPSDWAEEYIEKAEETGITEGFDGQWQANITREEYCNLLFNTISILKNPNWALLESTSFTDTKNEKINNLKNYGVINGKSETEFCPDDLLTREEAATLLCRVYEKYNGFTSANNERYADDESISDWSRDKVYEVTELGIMNGVGDNKFAPLENYNTEQAVCTLVRLYDILDTKSELTFADKLNKHMPETENYMFSPLSVKMAFLLAANGAEGNTLTEILDTFDIKDLEQENKNAKEMIETYLNNGVFTLNIANSVWLNKDKTATNFKKSYISKVNEMLNAESGTITNADGADKINGWVNKKTNGKITEIIDKPDFEALLLNAVYFNALWQEPFEASNTYSDTFTNINGKKTTIDFMCKKDHYFYSDSGNIQIIELPYKTAVNRISMYVMMSDDEFNPVEALGNADFSSERIILSLPKFEYEFTKPLTGTLKEMGIKSAFSGGFGKMFEDDGMFITDVLHKTYIRVDEKGTEAAAVTAIAMGTGAVQERPLIVKFDKPFSYVIKDNTNGEILFMGRCADLTEETTPDK